MFRQHRAFLAVRDRPLDVHDVLRPQHHVDRLMDGVGGVDVALEHDGRVGLEESGALRPAALHERDPQRPDVVAGRRQRAPHDDAGDDHAGDHREPPPGARSRRRARRRPPRWRGRAATSRRGGRRGRAGCRSVPSPAGTPGRRRTASAPAMPPPASMRPAARSTGPERSAGRPCTPARTRRSSTRPRSRSRAP